MKERPLISVIIPCYNAEKYLPIAINSILNQSYSNLEVILYDDGSTDSTRNILKSFLNDGRVKLFYHEINQGIIKTLNESIKHASGDFIARMDGDDISLERRFEVLLRYMLKEPSIDLIASACEFIDSSGRVIQNVPPKGTTSKALKFISFFSTPVIHGGVMAKASVFKNNLYESNYLHSEDFRLFSKLALDGFNLFNASECLYQHRVYEESISSKYESIQIQTHLEISRKNLHYYFQDNPGKDIQSIVANRFSSGFSISSIINAFKYLNRCFILFKNRENCSSKDVMEIKKFMIEQRIDILIQALKRAKGLKKIVIATLIMKYLKVFIHTDGFKYFLGKFKSRVNFLQIWLI